MPAINTCPNADSLEQFSLGNVAEPTLSEIAEHLESCSRCLSAIRTLTPADTLVKSVASLVQANDPAQDTLVQRLMERLRMGDANQTMSHGTADNSNPQQNTEPGDDKLDTSFLAPAQAHGEIGRLGSYRILSVLGHGGMGIVFEAEDTKLKRRIALKVMKPEVAAKESYRVRFMREAETAAKVEHDHICPIYQIDEHNGVPFIAMPFLKGESLESALKRQRPMPIGEAVRIAREMSEGLTVAHADGLVHRDIKPGNVWLESLAGRPPRVRILDFGLARLQSDPMHLTASGAIMGTPAYMAPEQARGKAVDARADLFSLGCVLYEMTTGTRPFNGPDTIAILSSLALDNPDPPHTINPKCPQALSNLTIQLLAKEPSQRPASADIVAKKLALLEMPTIEAIEGVEIESPSDPWSRIEDTDHTLPMAASANAEASASVKPRKRRVLPLVAIAIGLVLIGIGIFFSGTIIRVANNEGELIVEVDDPNTEVVVKDGNVEIHRTGGNDKKKIFILNAGKDGEVEIREPGSDTVLVVEKFKVTRGGKTEVLVTAAKLAASRKNVDTDRRAAEYVLFIGGNVRLAVNGKEANPKAIGELPRGPFQLRIIDLSQNAKVSDDGLANFKDCSELTHLFLQGTQVGDRGLAHLKSCKNLNRLDLTKTKVTVQGIADLKKALPNIKIEWETGAIGPSSIEPKPLTAEQRKSLEWVLANGGEIEVDVAGKLQSIAAGARLPEGRMVLHGLNTNLIKDLGGKAIDRLRDVPPIRQNLSFYRAGSELTDDALGKLATISGLRTATDLCFLNTAITDAGLSHLERFRLLNVDLRGCEGITNAGLVELAKHGMLLTIQLNRTKVTKDGVEKFAVALPQCKIEWDGGVIESNRFTNSLGMEFALVPKGKAWLGGGGGKPGDKQVEFKDDYYLGVYEVTQEEWQKVTGLTPSHFSRTGGGKDGVRDIADAELKRFPVENVSYVDIQLFLSKLNERDRQAGWVYRLPTGDEWEYACRGGSMQDRIASAFDGYFNKPTNTITADLANIKAAGGLTRPTRVGNYPANPLGLHDMIGNVWELCEDAVDDKPEPGRRLRGGFFGDTQQYCRAAGLGWAVARHRSKDIGFRVARVRTDTSPRYKNSLGMEFALVPKGKAWLGGGGGKVGDREVEFNNDYYIGIYSVTQEEWEKVTGSNAAHYSRNGYRKDAVKDISDADLKRFPVEGVSYADVEAFLAKLNERDKQGGWVYRLPTSDEWEFACRGGPMTDRAESAFHFYSGKPSNDLPPDKCNYARKDGPNRTVKVGQFDPNKLGIFDMHGNVLEWCSDAGIDPKWGNYHVARGGSWNDPRFGAAQVLKFSPDKRYPSLGVRIVRVRTTSGQASTDPALLTVAQRKALEWVLATGGRMALVVDGKVVTAAPGDKLPDRPFTIGTLNLSPIKSMVGYETLKDLPKVADYMFLGPAANDDMLAQLVTYPGIAHARKLNLSGPSFTDACVPHLQKFYRMTDLAIAGTSISNAGLVQLRELKITSLNLRDAKQFNDDSLTELARMKGLTQLSLVATSITDTGIMRLAPIENLAILVVSKTAVTKEGAEKLSAALPGCRIEHEKWVIEPKTGMEPERRAAEWVLSVGGFVDIHENGKTQKIRAGEKLPDGNFIVTSVDVRGEKVTDAGLAVFKGCTNLTYLIVQNPNVTDVGLANFKDCTRLDYLNLEGTRLTAAGLVHFEKNESLKGLVLLSTSIGDDAIERLSGFKQLSGLDVRFTNVTEAGSKKLITALPECKVEWAPPMKK